ncbi:hypothetical protein [Hymenobacter sp. UYCo722]|uniref:hypothetical protein n=1 Tax=Hymenobacter sp. UYCo722 TaxID=3156335 RepID=UPI0033966844
MNYTIAGASSPNQILANPKAAGLPALPTAQMQTVPTAYDRRIRPLVHFAWWLLKEISNIGTSCIAARCKAFRHFQLTPYK